MRGKSLKVVQELLGHATMEMTMRYAHLAPVVHRDAVDALDGPSPLKSSAACESR
jgi:site-specific recombinase XerD